MNTSISELQKLIKLNTDADNVEIIENFGAGDCAIVIAYKIDVPQVNLLIEGYSADLAEKIKTKLCDSNLIQSVLHKEYIKSEILSHDLERLSLDIQELKKYKIFFDLYKELNAV
jgi:hypothetical protein